MTTYTARHLNFLETGGTSAKEPWALTYFWVLAIFAVSVSSAAGYYVWQRNQIADVKVQLEVVSQEVARLKALELGRRQNEGGVNIVRDLLKNPFSWSELTRDAVRSVPKRVELVQLSGALANARKLLVKGRSSFLSSIFHLKDNLAGLERCKSPQIISVEQMVGTSGNDKLQFHMECDLS